MNTQNVILCVAFSLFGPVFSYDDFYQVTGCCTAHGPHFEDTEYTLTFMFNQNYMAEFNSTRGNWVGFTNFSIALATFWNNDPTDAAARALERKLLCAATLDIMPVLDNLTSIPTIKVKSVKSPNGRHPSMLVCSAYDFYPKQIRMTWMRNGQEVTTDVIYTEVMPDGDWYYQAHAYLEYTPTSAETITCMVEHLGLSEPMSVVWDPSLPAAEQTPIVVGLCGLIIGFVIAISGFIYYKKKSAAYISVCQRQVFIAVETLPEAGETEQPE
ncbi:rano class II histocompatibility antigen, A beta chain-like [Archocentrus centrarchus]|uniref:rano class II histocompatibility antigen, A beta chain-like n=1 Tax=Archocentrus centrarchus TaxID=63155 RepID=UPI0011EA468E|nr:rano class II histocompatibility antigen, A beta chain-like [Archocentrus centrarchus]